MKPVLAIATVSVVYSAQERHDHERSELPFQIDLAEGEFILIRQWNSFSYPLVESKDLVVQIDYAHLEVRCGLG